MSDWMHMPFAVVLGSLLLLHTDTVDFPGKYSSAYCYLCCHESWFMVSITRSITITTGKQSENTVFINRGSNRRDLYARWSRNTGVTTNVHSSAMIKMLRSNKLCLL